MYKITLWTLFSLVGGKSSQSYLDSWLIDTNKLLSLPAISAAILILWLSHNISVFTFQLANMDLIPSTPFGPLSPTRNDPWQQTQD